MERRAYDAAMAELEEVGLFCADAQPIQLTYLQPKSNQKRAPYLGAVVPRDRVLQVHAHPPHTRLHLLPYRPAELRLKQLRRLADLRGVQELKRRRLNEDSKHPNCPAD